MFWKDLNVLLTSDVKYDWVFFQVFVDFLEDLNFNIATGLSEVMIHFFFNLPMSWIPMCRILADLDLLGVSIMQW